MLRSGSNLQWVKEDNRKDDFRLTDVRSTNFFVIILPTYLNKHIER